MSLVEHYIKDVSPGLSEYFTEVHSLASDDYIDMEFNQDFVIQDLIVITTGTLEATRVLEVSIKYPQSQRVGVISTITAESSPTGPLEYFLNSTNDDTTVISTGHDGTGKQWYRIAPRTILRVKAISGESLSVRFNVIGRSA